MSRRRVVVLVAAVLLLGAGLGVAWSLVVPGLPAQVQPDGAALVLDPESRGRFTPVAGFALASVVLGSVVGAVAWRVCARQRGPSLVVVVVGAALGAGIVAQGIGIIAVGLRFPGRSDTGPGSIVETAPQLGTWLLAPLLALGAALSLAAVVSMSPDDELRTLPTDDR